MAHGRMLIREFSWDKRVWALSDTYIALFAAAIPHTETDGSLPADPVHLKALICPLSRHSEADIAAAVEAWCSTIPAMAERLGDRLRLVDFEKCNKNLSFMKVRRYRSNRCNQDGLQKPNPVTVTLEVKRSEEKRSEEKQKQQNNILDKPRKVPILASPKTPTALQTLLDGVFRDYFGMKPGDPNPKEKEAVAAAYRRFAKAGRDILAFARGDPAMARRGLEAVGDRMNRGGLDWNIETVAKRFPEWLNDPEAYEKETRNRR